MNIQWDADKYTDQFSFVHQYGSALIDMVGGEGLSVLDLGCGNGALTKELADRGHDAAGMDASEELLEIAREKYPDISFFRGDAADFHTERNSLQSFPMLFCTGSTGKSSRAWLPVSGMR